MSHLHRFALLGVLGVGFLTMGCPTDDVACDTAADCDCPTGTDPACIDGFCECSGTDPDGGMGATDGGGTGGIDGGGTGGSDTGGTGGDGTGGTGGAVTCGSPASSSNGDLSGSPQIIGADSGPIGTEFTTRFPITDATTEVFYQYTVVEENVPISIGNGGGMVTVGENSVDFTFTSAGGPPGTYPLSVVVIGDDPTMGRIYSTQPNCVDVYFQMQNGNMATDPVPAPGCTPVCLTITE